MSRRVHVDQLQSQNQVIAERDTGYQIIAERAGNESSGQGDSESSN